MPEMATTSRLLEQASENLNESLGVRQWETRPQLSPRPSPKDIGRKRRRDVGSVPIDRVQPDADQPRGEFPEEGLQRLGESIRAKGQLLPIHVRWSAEAEAWIIISGERRWRAAKAAGLATIDCIFHEVALDEAEILEQQLVENLLREDLRPIEEARAFAELMELNGWNGKQVAAALHIDPSKVSRSLALLDLPEDVQQRVEQGELAARSAYELSKLPDDKSRRTLADTVAGGRLTHRETAETVRQRTRRGRKQPPRKPGGTKLDFWSETGWKITVSSKGKGTYHDVEAALRQALDEVCLRIDNNVQLF